LLKNQPNFDIMIIPAINNIKAYYNKDRYSASFNYKGYPISATGSTEVSVYKSISSIMAFVDIILAKKLNNSSNKRQLEEVEI